MIVRAVVKIAMQSGRWAVCRSGQEPVEIRSGELFRVEVGGVLRVTRMERDPDGPCYSMDGYELCEGMRAAIGTGR